LKNKLPFSLLETFTVAFIVLTLAIIIMTFMKKAPDNSKKRNAMASAMSIGLIMTAYAEDDIKDFKMPYPLPNGYEKVWGNSKDCWSTSVIEMLFKQKYMRKGDERELLSKGNRGKTKSMYLNDATSFKNEFWEKNTALDFQVYCDKDLTSNATGKLVLVATYDNDDIRDCQFEGDGWVVFYADKSVEYVKRSTIYQYGTTSKMTTVVSVNDVEGSITGKGIVLRKDIPVSEGGPGNFGRMLGGGSTELMGKRDTDAIYKALVR
jgi:hypothetical protein